MKLRFSWVDCGVLLVLSALPVFSCKEGGAGSGGDESSFAGSPSDSGGSSEAPAGSANGGSESGNAAGGEDMSTTGSAGTTAGGATDAGTSAEAGAGGAEVPSEISHLASTGTVSGTSVKLVDGSVTIVHQGGATGAILFATSRVSTCDIMVDRIGALRIPASIQLLSASFLVNEAEEIELGTYALNYAFGSGVPKVGRAAAASFADLDAECLGEEIDAVSGTIEVNRVDEVGVAGAFSISFGTGTLTGNFDLPLCQEYMEAATSAHPEESSCVGPE